MALPIRGIPTLEGKVWREFQKEARKAEKECNTIDITKNMIEFRKIREDARSRGIFI
ncbi:MAG: hypothetical protein LBT35_04230 [Tannerella sp.]|jgi:hypothetical protein|nr:hypothetical protein [Tannerella sp.]